MQIVLPQSDAGVASRCGACHLKVARRFNPLGRICIRRPQSVGAVQNPDFPMGRTCRNLKRQLGAIHGKAGIAASGICRRFQPKVDERGLLVDIPSDRPSDFRPLDRIDRQSQSLPAVESLTRLGNHRISRSKLPARLAALTHRLIGNPLGRIEGFGRQLRQELVGGEREVDENREGVLGNLVHQA